MHAFIALGSNVEPRVRTMLAAIHMLSESPGLRIDAVSSVYQSEAHTSTEEPQDDYLNAVVKMSTSLEPATLLDVCLAVEVALGREARTKGNWLPRSIDLDVLLHSAGFTDTPGLTIPHPRIAERRFVLLPMADLLGLDHHVKELGSTIGELLRACPDRARTTRTVVDLTNYK